MTRTWRWTVTNSSDEMSIPSIAVGRMEDDFFSVGFPPLPLLAFRGEEESFLSFRRISSSAIFVSFVPPLVADRLFLTGLLWTFAPDGTSCLGTVLAFLPNDN